MNRIIVGSRAFFSGYSDFTSKNFNYLELVDNPTTFTWRHEYTLRRVCTFRYKKESVAMMVQRTLENGDPMLIGKFLVPEVAEAIGATVADILPLEPLLEALNERHRYIAIIFQAIKQNNSFVLTDDQRLTAYKAYKQSSKPDMPDE